MTRTDKRSHISDLPSKPGRRCSKQGRARQSLQDHQAGVWQVCGRGTDALIMDKQGRLITTEAEQDARGTEHFSEVLNRPPPPPTEADIQEAETDLDVNTDPPGKEEIIAAIKSLKNGKFPGQDNLSTEVFKADPQLAADLLQPLFADIWEGMKLPEDWRESHCEDSEERCPQQLQQLARNHPTICTQPDTGQDHHPANSRHSGPTTEKRAGRILERRGMHRPDLHPV